MSAAPDPVARWVVRLVWWSANSLMRSSIVMSGLASMYSSYSGPKPKSPNRPTVRVTVPSSSEEQAAPAATMTAAVPAARAVRKGLRVISRCFLVVLRMRDRLPRRTGFAKGAGAGERGAAV